MTSRQIDPSELYAALKQLIAAARPAQLAERVGMVLGDEYGRFLDEAIKRAEAAVK